MIKFAQRNIIQVNGNVEICEEKMAKVAPSIFAESKHGSRSDRYTYIPTIDIVRGLRKEGFLPFNVVQSKSRIEGKTEFTKHMIRFGKEGYLGEAERPEIILVNSHDGTSSYQLLAGFFRFVCSNGLITGDTIQDIKIPHRGNIVHDIIEGAYSTVNLLDTAKGEVENMKSITLSSEEQNIYAKAALQLKYGDEAPIQQHQLLTSARKEDSVPTIWNTFNKVQEKFIKGGLRGYNANGNRTTTREVKGIDSNIKLNKGLWILANEMAKLKV